MENFRLSRAPLSMKIFVSILLCIVGLAYLSVIFMIWLDTNFKPSLVAEGYGEMEAMELTHHAHTYLPYYALTLFTLPLLFFMFSSYSEKLKRVFAIYPFILIVIDIASMWLIHYAHRVIFSWTLVCAGICLALTFLTLFLLNFYDIWFRKAQTEN